MSKSGSAIYLSIKQQELILEALDMLTIDYSNNHPEQEEISKLESKIHSFLNYESDKKY